MNDRFFAAVAVLSVWVALVALSCLVVRALGWSAVKQQKGVLLILALSLSGLPGVVVLRKALPYKDRVLAYLLRKRSPPIEFANGCSIFPANNIWNSPVRGLPVDANSSAYIQSMGGDLPLHADFGIDSGIPYGVADSYEPVARVVFGSYQSDPGPYRIPDDAPVERGADHHVIEIDPAGCRLYELWLANRKGPHDWEAGSGAIYDLRSNKLRPEGWTSADAAGLPMLAGLLRYDEVQSGEIRHALRFTSRFTRAAFVWPARHLASQSNDPTFPAMGQRFRLRGSFDVTGFSRDTQVILNALKEYGMMLSDNGGPWYLTGTPDSRWSRATVRELGRVMGSDFEAVDATRLMVDRNSGEARR